ncbi:hypothetical protein D3C86_807880 [compost metagenome]
MQVRAGRIAGRADQADPLARGDLLARMHIDAAEVAIDAAQAIGVLHLDEVTVAAGLETGAHHPPFGGRIDAGALGRGDVDALVGAGLGLDGQLAQTKGRVDPIALHRGLEHDLAHQGTGGLGHRRHRRSGGGRQILDLVRGGIGAVQRGGGHGENSSAGQHGDLTDMKHERPGGRGYETHTKTTAPGALSSGRAVVVAQCAGGGRTLADGRGCPFLASHRDLNGAPRGRHGVAAMEPNPWAKKKKPRDLCRAAPFPSCRTPYSGRVSCTPPMWLSA